MAFLPLLSFYIIVFIFYFMSIKQQSVSMPVGSAGLIPSTSDVKYSGFELDPNVFIIGTTIFVLVVKLSALIK
jgi:hypothetical protein